MRAEIELSTIDVDMNIEFRDVSLDMNRVKTRLDTWECQEMKCSISVIYDLLTNDYIIYIL